MEKSPNHSVLIQVEEHSSVGECAVEEKHRKISLLLPKRVLLGLIVLLLSVVNGIDI